MPLSQTFSAWDELARRGQYMALEEARVKSAREQLAGSLVFDFALEIRKDHWNVAAEFPNDLPACAAGRRQCVGIRDDRNSIEAVFPSRDGFEDSHALRAAGEAVAGVFHVAAGIDSPRFCAYCRAHTEVGERRVGVLPCQLRCRN